LTIAGSRAYARLGKQSLAPGRDGPAAGASYLVCLDLGAARGRELWVAQPPADDGQPALLEGAPLVRGGYAYIAVSRVVGKRTRTALACYDPRGKLRWTRAVCDCPEFEDESAPRRAHHLLTWAGQHLVYCSHAGAVVALDPSSGELHWGVRYPSRGPLTAAGAPAPRDLAPCVYADGRLLLAPLDTDRLYCLEATSGRVLWEQEGVEIIHLLGVAGGRVYFTTPRGVQATALADGAVVWQQPAQGELASLGRGLLLGDWLFWPTQDATLPVRALTLTAGEQYSSAESAAYLEPTRLRPIPAGNLVYGAGYLIVAGPDELVVFAPPGD
jgi:outer membrane protein assembly factor BamB